MHGLETVHDRRFSHVRIGTVGWSFTSERRQVVGQERREWVVSSTDHLQSVTRRRLPSWATPALVLALLSTGVLLFGIVVLVDSLRQATGWELGQPLMFLVAALLTSVGVAGSGVAARLAWVLPARSKLMAVVAAAGLVATFVGCLLTIRSFVVYVMPGIEGGRAGV